MPADSFSKFQKQDRDPENKGREHVKFKLSWLDRLMFDPRKNDIDLAVAYVLAWHIRREHGDAIIDQKHIAKLLGMGVSSVGRSIRRLVKLGYLTVQYGVTQSRYRWVLPVGQFDRVDDAVAETSVGQKRRTTRSKTTSHSVNSTDKYKISDFPCDETSDKRESDADASPLAPADLPEGASCAIGITMPPPIFSAPMAASSVVDVDFAHRTRVRDGSSNYRAYMPPRRDETPQPEGPDTKPAPSSSRAANGHANGKAAPRSAGKRVGGGTTVPDKLSGADRDYALAHGMDIDAAAKLAIRFINHYRAEGKRLHDWSAKWRNWVDKEPPAPPKRLDKSIL